MATAAELILKQIQGSAGDDTPFRHSVTLTTPRGPRTFILNFGSGKDVNVDYIQSLLSQINDRLLDRPEPVIPLRPPKEGFVGPALDWLKDKFRSQKLVKHSGQQKMQDEIDKERKAREAVQEQLKN